MNEDRRDFLKLMGLGIVYASALPGCAAREAAPLAPTDTNAAKAAGNDFFFAQLTDTHWGFHGAPNPEADTTLRRAVAAINAMPTKPDFVVFTGDLTHMTDDPAVRRQRMTEFKKIASELEVKNLRFLPGEHDASLDHGEAYKEHFGDTRYAFDHKGIHFVALDNVSTNDSILGEEQLEWLRSDLARLSKEQPIVVLAHRPLFDLFPAWDWHTKDGARAIELLTPYEYVTVFYGHIHQEHHHTTGRIAHHSARSLMFPLPAPGSVPKRAPLPWDPAAKDHGVGFREVRVHGETATAKEIPV